MKGAIWLQTPNSIVARWRNYFSQLLNVNRVNDVRQAEIHISQPVVPEPSAFEFEMSIENFTFSVLKS
jgi:hypothetical protein